MSQAAPPVSSGSRPSRRRRRLLVLCALTLPLLAWACWAGWRWWTAPVPPQVSLEGVEPAVATAVTDAERRVRAEPRSGAAWGHLGMVLRVHAFEQEADTCFARAERLDPENPRWPYYQGLRRLLLDPEAALPYLRRAVDLTRRHAPRVTGPSLLLAEALLQKGDTDEAEAILRGVLERDPDDPRVHYDLGLVAVARRQWPLAIDHLSRAADSPFARRKANTQLAVIHQRLHDDTAAAACGRRASTPPQDLPWKDAYIAEYLKLGVGRQSRFQTVERMEAEGQVGEADAVLRKMTREFPDDRSLVALGINQAKLGQFEEAEQALRQAARLAPDKVQAHYFLAVSLYSQGERLRQQAGATSPQALAKYREAEASARRATELKSDHGYAYVYHGLALQRLGQRKEAIKAFRVAVSCRPEFHEPHLYLGETLAEDGQRADALKELRQAVRLAPEGDPRPGQALARWGRTAGPESK